MRIASYNVLDPELGRAVAPWTARREHVAATIDSVAPAILGLQEAGWSRVDGVTPAEDLAALTALSLGIVHDGDALLHDPTLVTAGASGWFPLPRARGQRPRSAVWQEFDGRFVVVATHFSHGIARERIRARQARRILERSRSALPIVVLGDLNSSRSPLGVLTRAGLREVTPRRRLDHILVSPGIESTDAGVADPVLPGPASDHLLVWADLRLER